MKDFFKNYKQTIILLVAIIIGAIVGMIFGEKAEVLAPFGDLFLNLMLVIVVPLIPLTMSISISKMSTPKRLGKIMTTIVVVFVVTSLIAVLIGFISTYFVKLVDTEDGNKILESLNAEEEAVEESTEELSILDRTVSALTVDDFQKLLSKENLIALIVFSIMFGVAMDVAR